MNLNDIIALAKQGYKPADIKELIEMAAEVPTQTDTEPTQTDTEPTQTDTIQQVTETATEPTQTDTEADKLRKQLADSQEALKKAQQANVQRNIADQVKKPEETLADMFASFM